MEKKSLGIIGGMGPLATADLFRKIILNTKADSDRGHIRIYIDNNTSVPDRTAAILYGKESPTGEIISSGKKLIASGAEILLIPCNTSHYFYDEISAALPVPVINMVETVCRYLKEKGVCRAAVLATDGTVKAGVYSKAMEKHGIIPVLPDCKAQAAVMKLIYDIKANGVAADAANVVEAMRDMCKIGVDTFVLACTELPLLLSSFSGGECVDPTLLLAKEAITLAGYECI